MTAPALAASLPEPPTKRLPCMNVWPVLAAADRVTVVCGLPRSGTSLLMRALRAGGLPLLEDGLRAADDRNPHGYFEWERVKAAEDYRSWMPQAHGRAVKVVSRHAVRLPPTEVYDVLFLHRALPSVLRSQQDMARHHTETVWQDSALADLGAVYRIHVADTLRWLQRRPNVRLHEMHYEQLVKSPREVLETMNRFLIRLGRPSLDVSAMVACVDPSLDHSGPAREPRDA